MKNIKLGHALSFYMHKLLHKKIKKILGISKTIRVFESPLLCIWQFECSVHIFRGPCFNILRFVKEKEDEKPISTSCIPNCFPTDFVVSHNRSVRLFFVKRFFFLSPQTLQEQNCHKNFATQYVLFVLCTAFTTGVFWFTEQFEY